jgi:hypothetical protein
MDWVLLTAFLYVVPSEATLLGETGHYHFQTQQECLEQGPALTLRTATSYGAMGAVMACVPGDTPENTRLDFVLDRTNAY